MVTYVLLKKKKGFYIKTLEDTNLSVNIEWLEKEALEKNIYCSIIVIITKRIWRDYIKLLDYEAMKAELKVLNPEQFDFLNDSNIVYYNNFSSGSRFPEITITPYQYQLF